MERPKTIEDIAALPSGGQFGTDMREINGQMRRCAVFVDVLTRASSLDDDTPRGYIDQHGTECRLGQYANGHYFRYPTVSIARASLKD